MLKKHNKKQIKKTKLSLQLFLMTNLYRVNGPIDMRVWKGHQFEIMTLVDAVLRSGCRSETGHRSESIIYNTGINCQ